MSAATLPLDWDRIGADLDSQGWALTGPLLPALDCAALAALFDQDPLFRSTIIMARHGFGSGSYRYFADPLPDPIARLRQGLYPPLAALANRWGERLGEAADWPEAHAALRTRCAAAGQSRPTPLLLRYGPGDYNCLHQDLYGPEVFPLQVAILLSDPARDFTGGEFVLVESRPRRQSRAEVVPLPQGQGVIFAVHHRPEPSARGHARVGLRHGVSRVRSGQRHVLGIIFHDAA